MEGKNYSTTEAECVAKCYPDCTQVRYDLRYYREGQAQLDRERDFRFSRKQT